MRCEIRIVESVSRYNEAINRKVREGSLDTVETGIVMTPETFAKVFSTERIKLLKRIYKNNIKSIYQLAKEMDKPYEVVYRNIRYLEGIGLLKVIEKENAKIPQMTCRFSIDMFGESA